VTILQAFKSAIEFEYNNDNLFTKILLDNALDGSGTYAATDEQSVDMCLADLYQYLTVHPDFKEGGTSQTWSKKALRTSRDELYRKWGLTPPSTNKVKGAQIW